MRKIIVNLLIFLLVTNLLSAQEKYFWSNNRKTYLTEDNNSMIIIPKKDAELTILNNNKHTKVIDKESSKIGNYKIIESSEKVENAIKFNESLVDISQYALITDYGEKLYPTQYILLKLKQGRNLTELKDVFKKFNITKFRKNYHVHTLKVENIRDVFNAANLIYESGIVEWCRPNFIRSLEKQYEPRDKQYYIHNVLHECNVYNHDINALEAWATTKGCEDIKVAVIDDGVEDHPALNDAAGNSRVLNGYSVPGYPANGRPSSNGDHGQCCAGIIAASHSTNIRGLAPNVKIVPVNIGYDNVDEEDWFIAMNWAWEPDGGNADILSNSWGPTYGASGNELKIEAINNAKIYGRGGDFENNIPGLGAIVVFSSGNNGLNEVSDYAKNSIAVGAIDKEDTPGKGLDGNKNDRYTNIGPNQDLVAYGGSMYQNNGDYDIRTIDRVGSNGYNSGDYNDVFGMTSAACPQVSGATALVLSINPHLSRTEVENILFSTATDLGDYSKDDTYGYGKLNVYEACKAAVSTRDLFFELNENTLSLSLFKDDFRTIFSASPGCGVAAGEYFCDIYKATGSASNDLTVVYTGDGLSAANPNSGEFYANISDDGSNINIKTFFFYIEYNLAGQSINKWVPYNPYNSYIRSYLTNQPEKNIVLNEEIESGETVEEYGTNIKLNPGFHAMHGSTFLAEILPLNDIIDCITNPNNGKDVLATNANRNDLESNNIEDFDITETQYNNKIKESNVKIYPNPTNNIVNIELPNLKYYYKIEIKDQFGKTVAFSNKINMQNKFNLSEFSKGMYLIYIYGEDGVQVEKLILN